MTRDEKVSIDIGKFSVFVARKTHVNLYDLLLA